MAAGNLVPETNTDSTHLVGPSPPAGLEGIRKARWAAKHPPKDPQVSFSGKTVLVTGSNTGLGLQAAIKYAALGASTLILGVRSVKKGEAAKNTIIMQAGCSADVIKIRQIDMSTFASVQEFARKLSTEFEQLDVALLNAGVATHTHTTGPEGWEMALQVNVLSTALLAVLLLPMLRATATKTGRPSHLEFTGSIAHQEVKAEQIDLAPNDSLLEKIDGYAFFEARKHYGVLKLLVMYVMIGLLDKCRTPNGDLKVIVNAACPGFCRTDLGRGWPWHLALPSKALQVFVGRTAENGARTLVSGTLLGKDGHGKFWSNDVFETLGVLVTSDVGKKLQTKAWTEILDVLEKHAPSIRAILDGGM